MGRVATAGLIWTECPQRLTSLEEDRKKDQAEIIADQAHWKKHGTNRRNGASKPEIMEELSRERFPLEE